MKIKDLLSSESKWCQGKHSFDAKGVLCNSTDDDAARWSLFGAMCKCYLKNADFDVVYVRVIGEIYQRTGLKDINRFNDSNPFITIKSLVERLDI